MVYSVRLFRSVDSSWPEINTQVAASDPSEACLTVMSQFGLTYASYVAVRGPGSRLVGEFTDVSVSLHDTSSSTADLLAYDYYGL